VRATRVDNRGFGKRLGEHYAVLRFAPVWWHWRRSPPWAGFGEPLNGQSTRQSVMRRLIELFEPDVIVETGTFLGDTTRWLSQLGVPVVSVELEPAFFRLAKRRLRGALDVELICGASVDALAMLARRPNVSRPLLYLDAHWREGNPRNEDEANPLGEEVAAVLSAWADALIVIDDFLVPTDSGYGYDTSRGEPLSEAMLELPDDAIVAYPGTPATIESGGRRGAAFIGKGADAREAIRTLSSEGLLSEA